MKTTHAIAFHVFLAYCFFIPFNCYAEANFSPRAKTISNINNVMLGNRDSLPFEVKKFVSDWLDDNVKFFSFVSSDSHSVTNEPTNKQSDYIYCWMHERGLNYSVKEINEGIKVLGYFCLHIFLLILGICLSWCRHYPLRDLPKEIVYYNFIYPICSLIETFVVWPIQELVYRWTHNDHDN